MRACRQIFVFQGNKKQGLGFGAGVIKKKANDLLMRLFSLEVINHYSPRSSTPRQIGCALYRSYLWRETGGAPREIILWAYSKNPYSKNRLTPCGYFPLPLN
jgi:hypothetical protein